MSALPPGRLQALDAFRGATIAAMLLVNNAGDWQHTFWPLLHAPWHGCTPTDLIFPFFLFILGVAIPYALAAPLERAGGCRRALLPRLLRRVLLLLALGLFLTWFRLEPIDWSTVRLPGVLQRIALVYGLAALAYLYLKPRGRLLLGLGILAGYWAAMKLVPVPGFGAGDLSAQGNLAAWVDQQVLGRHIWKYAPGPGDPEGLLSTFPALASALAGIATGEWLRAARGLGEKLRGLLLTGLASLAAGLLLHPWFPINKSLWTSSYVLFTTGAALLSLASAIYLMDLRGWQGWASPFLVFGANSIAAFAGSTFVAKLLYLIDWVGPEGQRVTLQSWLYERFFVPVLPPYWASLAWASAYLGLWLALMGVLYRRRVFLKV